MHKCGRGVMVPSRIGITSSPASARAPSYESTTSTEPATTSEPISRVVGRYAPIALMWALGLSSSNANRGSVLVVQVQMMSARLRSGASPTEIGMSSSASSRPLNSVPSPGVKGKSRTSLMSNNVVKAWTCAKACTPVQTCREHRLRIYPVGRSPARMRPRSAPRSGIRHPSGQDFAGFGADVKVCRVDQREVSGRVLVHYRDQF